MSEIIYCTNQP